MNLKLYGGLLGLALSLAPAVWGQPSDIFQNDGIIDVPSQAYPYAPPIDALAFFNNRQAIFGITNLTIKPFDGWTDVINFTNKGFMAGFSGFDFETFPADGPARPAANFVNIGSGVNGGVINCSSVNYTPFYGLGQCLVSATNIVNSGTIALAASHLIKLSGKNIDLTRGTLTMANPADATVLGAAGQLDGYWGVGTAAGDYPKNGQTTLLFPPQLLSGQSPSHNITNRNFQYIINNLTVPNPVAYINDSGTFNSNRFVQAVMLNSANPGFINSVFFNSAEIVVQWQWTSTNPITGAVRTNYVYLTDNFGEVTNLQVLLNGVINPQANYPTFTEKPFNYDFFQGTPFPGTAFPPSTPAAGVLGNSIVTNQYAAYEALFSTAPQLPTDTAGGDVTNLAGRVEITADSTLNLSMARITALDYVLLRSTNHLVTSTNAQITAPNFDLYLRATNGVLAITNIVPPFMNQLTGPIDLWSTRWTNMVGGVTNIFHVLLVNSQISPVVIPQVQTLNLAVTNSPGAAGQNLLISDVLNVTKTLALNSRSITLTTNSQNQFTPMGQLNMLNPSFLWPTVTPGLQFLTNWGVLSAPNAVFFGGSHNQPPYNTNLANASYQAFVNHGTVTNNGSLVWSTYFQNNGVFQAGSGAFRLEQAAVTILNNGAINAAGDISLASASLLISNHVLQAGGALTLAATNLLDDGSLNNIVDTISNKNTWVAGGGLNLPQLPPGASLLATTVTNTAVDYQLVLNQWAGADLGNSPAGFTNNAALGRMILTGSNNCLFEFQGTGAANALYVDSLEFRDFATNVDSGKNYVAVELDPNMKIYYAQALANGVSVAERLNGKNNGRFLWVSNYMTGFYSSTNVTYPDGTKHRLNTALAQSCDIDSNGNGIVNCMDNAPIPALWSGAIALAVGYTNQPAAAAAVSWSTFPSTMNYLYAASSFSSTNWQLVTNFVFSGPSPGRVTVTDPIKPSGPRFYRVRVDSH